MYIRMKKMAQNVGTKSKTTYIAKEMSSIEHSHVCDIEGLQAYNKDID